ncbi:MAG: hypothetical protein U1E76_20070 [Planctomycetota bacterium]
MLTSTVLSIVLALAGDPVQETPVTDVDQAVLDMVSSIAERIAEIRGRPFKHPVDAGIRTREQLTEFMKRQFEKDLPPAEARKFELRLRHLGLWPADLPVAETMVSFLTLQVGGFYDPETKKLYCITSKLGTLQQIVMAHEIHHALQDQYTDLQKFYDDVKQDEDRLAARQAVVEGDAQFMSTLYMAQNALEIAGSLSSNDPRAVGKLVMEQLLSLGAAPPVLSEIMTFPYLQGAELVGAVKNKLGFDGVNGLFVSPPVSTEQVLHPDKYLSGGDPPVELVPPDVSSVLPGYELVDRNTAGELMVSIWGKLTGQDPVRALRGSRGWGGDVYELWSRGRSDATLLVWWSTWDTERDAVEFVDLARKCLRLRRGADDGQARLEEVDGSVRLAGGYGRSTIERHGSDVLLIDGAIDRAEQLAELVKVAWALGRKS